MYYVEENENYKELTFEKGNILMLSAGDEKQGARGLRSTGRIWYSILLFSRGFNVTVI